MPLAAGCRQGQLRWRASLCLINWKINWSHKGLGPGGRRPSCRGAAWWGPGDGPWGPVNSQFPAAQHIAVPHASPLSPPLCPLPWLLPPPGLHPLLGLLSPPRVEGSRRTSPQSAPSAPWAQWAVRWWGGAETALDCPLPAEQRDIERMALGKAGPGEMGFQERKERLAAFCLGSPPFPAGSSGPPWCPPSSLSPRIPQLWDSPRATPSPPRLPSLLAHPFFAKPTSLSSSVLGWLSRVAIAEFHGPVALECLTAPEATSPRGKRQQDRFLLRPCS